MKHTNVPLNKHAHQVDTHATQVTSAALGSYARMASVQLLVKHLAPAQLPQIAVQPTTATRTRNVQKYA
jgi:phage tail protein X